MGEDTGLAHARAEHLRRSPAKIGTGSGAPTQVHPVERKRQVRSELHKTLSEGLLDSEPVVGAVAGLPKLAAPGTSAAPSADSRDLHRVHTSTHSPLAGYVQGGRDLTFHLVEDIPASQRLILRSALESRGWRVEYNISAATRLRQRGVIVMPDQIVQTRGTRVVELEQAGVHVASIEQLLKLLKHPAGYKRVQDPQPSESKNSPTRISRSASQTSELKGNSSRRTHSGALDTDASRASVAQSGPVASPSPTQSSWSIPGGWPAWVLDVSERSSIDELSPHAAERLEAVQAAHKEKSIANARQRQLREAVVEGELRAVKAALRDHPDDVHGKDERGRSAFWLAVLSGRAEMVELIADAGAVVDEEAADGATALFAACHAGNQEVTQTLLDLGCNPEKLTLKRGGDTSGGRTALFIAAERGHIGCAETLLQHGVAFVDKPSPHGQTPLSVACEGGHLEIARLLLFSGADCEVQDHSGSTAFMNACEGGHLDVAQLLIDWGADPDHVDNDGQSAWLIACSEGHCNVLCWLSNLGDHVDITRRDHRGQDSFFAATAAGHTDVLKLLEGLGLDEGGTFNNPFRQCWRGHRHLAHKDEQRAHDRKERVQGAIDKAMDQIYKPAKDYAECTAEERRTWRIHMLRKATGSWVNEFDRQQRISNRCVVSETTCFSYFVIHHQLPSLPFPLLLLKYQGARIRVAKHRENKQMQQKANERRIWQELSRVSLKDLCLRAQNIGVERSLLNQALESARPKHSVSVLVLQKRMLLLQARPTVYSSAQSDADSTCSPTSRAPGLEAGARGSSFHNTRSDEPATIDMETITDSGHATSSMQTCGVHSVPSTEDGIRSPLRRRQMKAAGRTVLSSLRQDEDNRLRKRHELKSQQQPPQAPQLQHGQAGRTSTRDQKHEDASKIAVQPTSTSSTDEKTAPKLAEQRLGSSARNGGGLHSADFHASLFERKSSDTQVTGSTKLIRRTTHAGAANHKRSPASAKGSHRIKAASGRPTAGCNSNDEQDRLISERRVRVVAKRKPGGKTVFEEVADGGAQVR